MSARHNVVALLLLSSILFLRLPFAAGILFFSHTTPPWVDASFQVGTYVLTALLIWWERDRAAAFHIDRAATAIIVLFKPIETIILSFRGLSPPPLLTFPNVWSLVV